MRNFECHEVIIRIADYIEDNLNVEEHQIIQVHLCECPQCQQECNACEQVSVVIQRWEPEPPSRVMWTYISQQIEIIGVPQRKQTLQWMQIRRWLFGGFATAAAGATAAVVWFMLAGNPAKPIPTDSRLVLKPDGYVNSYLHQTAGDEGPTEYIHLTAFGQ
jgi:hypothetical protein